MDVHFIVGVEGSGTTMMARILGSAENAEVLLGNYRSLNVAPHSDLARLMRMLNRSSAQMWHRKASVQEVASAQESFVAALSELMACDDLRGVSHLFLKRSAPFNIGDDYRPDLFDVVDLIPEVKILVMMREPCASTYSAYRREFVENIRHGALICEMQLLLLEGRLSQLDASQFMMLNYDLFCSAPEMIIPDIERFFGLASGSLNAGLANEEVTTIKKSMWREELPMDEVAYLSRYFDSRWRRQFKLLGGYLSQYD